MEKPIIYIFKSNEKYAVGVGCFDSIEEMLEREQFTNILIGDTFQIKVFKNLDALEQWQEKYGLEIF